METPPPDPGPIMTALQMVDEICVRYDKVLKRLQSNDEDDEEERWLLKEATKHVVDALEKETILKSKPIVMLTRALKMRAKKLIEKCEQVFPQLEEIVRLRSLISEIETLLNKSSPSPSALPKCPLCVRFGGHQLIAKGSVENENIFLYVAEKIVGPGTSGAARQKPKSPASTVEDMPNSGRAQVSAETDTQGQITPTLSSDVSRRSQKEENRKNLLWLDEDSDKDVKEPDHPLPQKPRGRSRSAEAVAPIKRTYESCHECHKPPERKSVEKPESGPVDMILSAEIGRDAPSLSVRVQEKSTSGARSTIVLILSTIFALNLVVQFIFWFCNSLVSTTAWPGVVLWPLYCKVANRLCKAEYNFACIDYCASRLARYEWQKKTN